MIQCLKVNTYDDAHCSSLMRRTDGCLTSIRRDFQMR